MDQAIYWAAQANLYAEGAGASLAGVIGLIPEALAESRASGDRSKLNDVLMAGSKAAIASADAYAAAGRAQNAALEAEMFPETAGGAAEEAAREAIDAYQNAVSAAKDYVDASRAVGPPPDEH